MKKVLTLVTVLIIITLIRFISLKTPTANINNHAFKLELAKTQQEKAIGLSKKEMLEKNAGMLFLFEKPDYYSFWMKDMKFPIDIIFIKKYHIVTIHKNVLPPINPNDRLPTFSPKEPADTVLEINAGLSEEYKFKEGDMVMFKNI